MVYLMSGCFLFKQFKNNDFKLVTKNTNNNDIEINDFKSFSLSKTTRMLSTYLK